MKVWREQDELVLAPGGLRGESRIVLARLTGWDFLYETLGRRFLAFHLGHETAHVSLPRLSPAAREKLLARLQAETGLAPDTSLLDMERDNTHWEKVWALIKTIGRYLRLFINPRAPLR